MAEQYTVADIIAAFHAENPDAKHLDDKEIFKAIAMEDPELIKGAVGYKAEPTQSQAGPVERFVSSGLGAIGGAVSGVYHAATDPMTESEKTSGFSLLPGMTAAKRMFIDPQIEQGRKAVDSFKQGNYSEAVGHGVAAAVPVYGPAAAAVGEQAGTGDFAGAAGTGLGFLAMDRVAKKVHDTGPEQVQDMATRARMYEKAHPSATKPLANINPFHPGSWLKYGTESAKGVVGAVSGGVVAPALDHVAKAQLALGGTPRGTTYEHPNPILDSGIPVSEAKIAPTGARAVPAQFESRFTPEELAAQASDHGAAGPQGEFSKLPNGGPDDPHWQDVNNATMNKSLGINEPEAVTAPVEQPPAEAPVEQPAAPPVEKAIPPTVQSVADKLVRRGRGAGGADLAIDNAQYLLRILPDIDRLSDVPDASDISPFDRVLNAELEGTGHKIGSRLESVKDKYISTGDAKIALDDLMDQARETGDTTTALKVKKLSDLFKDSAIDAGSRVNAIRQGLFNSELDISTGIGREVYDIFRGLTEKLDPELVDLNQRYFTLKTSGELAEMRQGGKSPESQVGAGTRPKANFKERMAANDAATKEAARMEKVKQIREENARKRDTKANDKAASDAKKEALKKTRDAEKAASAKSKEELRRKERMDAAARSSRDRGFRGGSL